jgi:hypothetical protein
MSDSDNEVSRFPTAKTIKVEDLIKAYDGIIDKVDELLRERAFSTSRPIPTAPDGVEELVEYGEYGDPFEPEDLTLFSHDQIGKLLSWFTSWANYAQTEATKAHCNLKVIERNVVVVKAALEIYYKEDKGIPANLVDNKVTVDPRFVEIDESRCAADVYYRHVTSAYEKMKRACNAISREQSRRSDELKREQQENSGDDPWKRGKTPRFRTRGR